MGLPRASSEFMHDFWQSPPAFSSTPQWIFRSTFARDCHAKIIENSFENRFRRVLGASRMAPGGLRESSRHASVISARFCGLKVISGIVILATLGLKVAPGRSRKSTENRLFAKKGAPRKAFLSIFAACAVFLDFSVDFGSVLSEKLMFFRMRFPHAARVFFEMATLTIVWFLQYESHFFIFRLRAFFREKR